MATLDGLDLEAAHEAREQLEVAAQAARVQLPIETERTTVTASTGDFNVAVTKLGLSPQDRDSFLRAVAFNVNSYRTAARGVDGKVLYQRLQGEHFTAQLINNNLDFIRDGALFPEFNFFVAPSLAEADTRAMLLLSNGLFVRGVFGRPNKEVELDPMNPSYYIELVAEDGTVTMERCGLAAVVAINTRFDYAKVPVVSRELYLSLPVALVYDTVENKKRYSVTEEQRAKKAQLERQHAKRRKTQKAAKASRKANR